MNKEPITVKMLEDAIKKVSEEPSEYREGYCNGYRIATNNFYYLIEDLEKENKELKERIDNAISTLYVWGETLRPTFKKEMLEILLDGDK